MKKLIVLSSALAFFGMPAMATPPDMVCSAGGPDDLVKFEIPLTTGYASLYNSGVIPLSSHHIYLEFGEPGASQKIEMYSDDMVAQWMLDDRVDLRLYTEIVVDGQEITSYDLIVRTKANGQVSLESGQKTHRGLFEFRAYSGSFKDRTSTIFFELVGDVVCE